jgi:hypothetical protein
MGEKRMTNPQKWEQIKAVAKMIGRDPYDLLMEWMMEQASKKLHRERAKSKRGQ